MGDDGIISKGALQVKMEVTQGFTGNLPSREMKRLCGPVSSPNLSLPGELTVLILCMSVLFVSYEI